MLRPLTLFFLLILFIASAQAQKAAQKDSTSQLKKSIDSKKTKYDSLDQKVNGKIDSVQTKINSLLNPNLSLNNVFSKAKHKTDNLKPDSLAQSKQKLDSIKGGLTHKIDSLKGLNLPTEKYTRKLDSLNQMGPGKYINQAEAKVNAIENKINAPVKNAEGKINEKLDLMNKEGGAGANLPGNANLPGANLKTDLDLQNKSGLTSPDLKANNPLGKVDNPIKGQMEEAGELKNKLSDIKSAPQEQINKVKSLEEVKGAQEKIGKANEITDKAQSYQSDVKNIAQGKVGDVKELPKNLEDQAKKMEGVQDIQKQAGEFDQYKDMAGKAKNPEALKQEAMKQATTMAVDHFAGKEEVLKAAMDKMSKLKSKYSELSSLKDIPKRRPNEMKGKPFIERIVPGITLQIQKKNDVIIDYNPLLGYRIAGKLTAGAGWNERFNVGKHFSFTLKDRIYGPRVFVDFKVGKGFSVRTDVEKMNTYVPFMTASGPTTGDGRRTWVWSAFIGIKKDYQFVKGVRGNAQFLYNLYDDHYNSPYADRLNVRMGFEFPMKKKKKKAEVTK